MDDYNTYKTERTRAGDEETLSELEFVEKAIKENNRDILDSYIQDYKENILNYNVSTIANYEKRNVIELIRELMPKLLEDTPSAEAKILKVVEDFYYKTMKENRYINPQSMRIIIDYMSGKVSAETKSELDSAKVIINAIPLIDSNSEAMTIPIQKSLLDI